MLRESSTKEGSPATLRGLTDSTIDLGVPHGSALRHLSTALVEWDRVGVEKAVGDIVAALGAEAAVTAVGVVANFQMMNRALDAVGIPAQLDPALAAELDIEPGTFGGVHGS